ncbi:hypothetical protein ACJX0J_006159, partial [Zea mays]
SQSWLGIARKKRKTGKPRCNFCDNSWIFRFCIAPFEFLGDGMSPNIYNVLIILLSDWILVNFNVLLNTFYKFLKNTIGYGIIMKRNVGPLRNSSILIKKRIATGQVAIGISLLPIVS